VQGRDLIDPDFAPVKMIYCSGEKADGI
jgi:hypothetical protein